ncbi:hypothetical protein J2T13_003607 [Paenibacillus sp. DS2015]|uniref:hypothetical protein n=1 Tax=Paenibacillus sp. DS2015 TaxID=3373917 RepID=UPI003D1F1BE3
MKIFGFRSKKKWKMFLASITYAFILMVIVIAIIDPSSEKTATPDEATPAVTTEPVVSTEAKVDWKSSVATIAKSDKTETEKFDEVNVLAKSYVPNEGEIKEFEDYIVKEFNDGTYLSDIKNHEYMLTNIFKANIVEQHYDDSENNPIVKFAYDFWQNTKYTYRGADTVDSDAVKSNESQMTKSLAKIK